MIQNSEIVAAVSFGIGLVAALTHPSYTLVILAITVLFIGVVISQTLELRLRSRSRDRYYLALPLLFGAFSFAAIQPLRTGPFAVPLLLALVILYYSLHRSLIARKAHPKAVINLHQNSFLFCSWVCLVIAVIGLFGSLDRSLWELLVTNLLIFLLVFVLIQSLLFYVRIAPWDYRTESLIGAFGISQFAAVQSLSTINPLVAAGLCFMLFYIYWGLTYHSIKNLLTRRLLYEYLLLGSVGILLLLTLSRLHLSA